MERKIGEIFEYNGEYYQVVECSKDNYPCIGCYGCKSVGGSRINGGECNGNAREDNKFVIFKKLEKVGEPFERQGYFYQEYKAHIYPLLMNGGVKLPTANGFAVIINQTKEDMEEKKPTYEELLHYYHSTVGLWAIDKNPQEVSLDWICDNAFQLGIDAKHSNSENIGKKLKPFDLEAAKSGKPVCTRDGRKVRIICFDYKGDCCVYPILALISTTNQFGVPDETIVKYTEDGKYAKYNSTENDEDLMMLPEKKTGWINIYPYQCEEKIAITGACAYKTQKDAKENASSGCIATVPIEWEE